MDTVSGDPSELVYSHRPSLMGAAWEFTLGKDALAWRVGAREGRVPYRRIARLRLSFRPVTMQSRRFLAELWPMEGPKLTIASTSWRSMFEQEAKDEAYGAFLRALHQRIAAAGGAAAFERGLPRLLYWPGFIVFAGTVLALAALTLRALQSGALAAAALIGGFVAVFLWQGAIFFRRNRPGRYRPEALPAELVPGG